MKNKYLVVFVFFWLFLYLFVFVSMTETPIAESISEDCIIITFEDLSTGCEYQDRDTFIIPIEVKG